VRFVVAIVLLTAFFAMASTERAEAAAPTVNGKLLAHKYLKAKAGGVVRAGNGVKLFVPAQVMQADGLATITRVRRGIYDIHIAAPWRGSVAVSFPRRRSSSNHIAHRVAGTWLLERPAGRSRTLWVSSLSWLTDITKVIKKLKIENCLKKDGRLAKLVCIADSGIELPLEVLAEILRGADDECRKQTLAFARPAPGGNFLLPKEATTTPCLRNGGKSVPEPGRPAPAPHAPVAPLPPLNAQPKPEAMTVAPSAPTQGQPAPPAPTQPPPPPAPPPPPPSTTTRKFPP